MALARPSSQHPRWDALKNSFKQSNYITDFWNWLLTFLSKSAELILFGSILYSSYQLIPGVPHVQATVDAVLFVIQQAALDIGGMGLLKLAKKAGLPKDSFPMRVGVTLVILMILNVVLASVKHSLPMIPDGVFITIETILLIARAIMAVLFGHAIHALREEYGDSTITMKDANALQQQVAQLSSELAQAQQHFHERLSSELAIFHEQLSLELSGIRSGFHERLSSELSLLQENFHQYQPMLSTFPQLETQMQCIPHLQAKLQQIESVTVEELRRVKVTLEKQVLGPIVESQQRPQLHALPSTRAISAASTSVGKPASHTKETRQSSQQQGPAEGKFDARAFVFACLETNTDLKLSEVEHLALARGQELSQPTISRYRKQFFASRESSHESPTMKAESLAVGQ